MFFQTCDKFWSNHKVVDLIDTFGWTAASGAIALWTLAGSHCRGTGLDGLLTTARISRLVGGMAPELAAEASALLVQINLWHTAGHTCDKCPPVPEGHFLFHQWFQFKYATAAEERETSARQKELRTPAITEAVWARDTDTKGVAHCRYCPKVVRPPAKGTHGGLRRGDDVGQLDHVDPTRALGATNIVVSCPECNQKKGARTPEQAGMKLLPPPRRRRTDQVRGQDPIKTGSTPEVSPTGAHPRGGAGGVGVGTGVGVGLGLAPPADHRPQGQAGTAPTVATPTMFGSPWKDHHGPPPPADLIAQATCPDHDLPRPCRRCASAPRPASTWPSSPAELTPPPTPPSPPRGRRRGSRGRRGRTPQGES